MKNFFIRVSEDKKTIKMSEEKHTATISLFGIKLLIGFSEEDRTFSFGFNKTKLINKTKKLFNRLMDFFQKNKNAELDKNALIGELKEEIHEEVQPEVDDDELTVKANNYIGTVKIFGMGIVISFNRRYKNFINFKQDKVQQTYNGVKLNVKEAK